MKQRLLVAAIGVPLLILVLVFLPPLATGILVAAIAGAAAYELLHTACKRPKRLYIITICCAALIVLLLALGTAVTETLIYAFLYVMCLFLLAVRTHGTEHAIPFTDVAVCIVAAFLFPAMYGCIALLRSIGPAFVLMPFVVAFIGDSFSMLGGMAFGHKKFAPNVSPNKTWGADIFLKRQHFPSMPDNRCRSRSRQIPPPIDPSDDICRLLRCFFNIFWCLCLYINAFATI